MIALGLRLAMAGRRQAVPQLLIIVVAVAVGVGLLSTTVAALNAVKAQNSRYAWLETGYGGAQALTGQATAGATHDPLWWQLRADYFQGQQIGRADVAATGANPPVPPGIPRLPAPGEFYASPALATLLRATPPAQLGDRYPGTLVGTIDPAGLPAPNSLIIIIGRSASEVSGNGGQLVTSISSISPSDCRGDCGPFGIDAAGMTLILSVVSAALLFPVLILIGGATRLSATRREQRFAAMRLVGATPHQIAMISTVESVAAALAGTVAGLGLYTTLRPSMAAIPFTGAPFFTADLSLSILDVLSVAVGIPVAAALAARLALHRVKVSPLGVTRRVAPHPPGAWRLIPLVAGVGELSYLAFISDIGDTQKHTSNEQAVAYLIGLLLVMAGLVLSGPWLTMLGSRLLATHANRAATLIAARRLSDAPQVAFRAISGLVLALFVGTCTIGVITSVVADHGTPARTDAAADILVDQLGGDTRPPGTTSSRPVLTSRLLTAITGVTGVTGIAEIHAATTSQGRFPVRGEVVSCAQLAGIPFLGRCPPGADTVRITPDFTSKSLRQLSLTNTTWTRVDMASTELETLPVDTLVISANGSAGAVEQVRTTLESTDNPLPPRTIGELQADRKWDGYRQLANVVIFTSLTIAGCALAVNVAASLAERKRPFALLRLSGAPLTVLRRVVALETVVPLLVTAAVSIAAALLCAQLFLQAQLRETLRGLGAQYYLTVLAGLLVALGIIASTIPVLNRITSHGASLNE